MWFLLLFVFISPLYIHSNLGRESLFYPFNSLVWILVSLCVLVFAGYQLNRKSFYIVKDYFISIAFTLVMLLLGGMLSGILNHYEWFVRIIAILIGFLFFTSLYQLQLNKRTVENCLFLLVFAIFMQAVIGYVQIFDHNNFIFWIVKYSDPIPLGHFQQPNLFASMMATLLIVSIYLVSQPSFKNRSILLKLVLMASIFSSTFMVVSSGSRVGFFSLIIVLPLILLTRFFLLKRHMFIFSSVLLLIVLGATTGSLSNEGFSNTVTKIESFSSDDTQDIRIHLYTIGVNVFLDSPLTGHGIGSFQSVFHEYAAEYQAKKGGESLIGQTAFSHPHNEFLYWAIEIGVLGVIALLMLVFMIFRAAYRQGWQSGGAKLAMLLPIALHTQVENPFYLSDYHYVFFIFLFFVLLYQKRRCELISFTRSASVTAQLFLAMLFCMVFYYCALAFNYSKRITLAIIQTGQLTELYQISKHPFFNDLATNLILASEFEHERGSESTLMSAFFADWLDDRVVSEPNPSYYLQMMDVHIYLGNEEKLKETAMRALYLFPNHPIIMNFIIENEIEL